jgi:hypothetical protein
LLKLMRLAKDIFLDNYRSPLLNFGLTHNSLLVCFVIAAKIVWKHLLFEGAFLLSGYSGEILIYKGRKYLLILLGFWGKFTITFTVRVSTQTKTLFAELCSGNINYNWIGHEECIPAT